MDLQKKVAGEEAKYFEDLLKYAARIRQIARKLLGDPDLRVLVFWVGGSRRGDTRQERHRRARHIQESTCKSPSAGGAAC